MEKLNDNEINLLNDILNDQKDKIAILAGCPNHGPCFCTGACQKIVGYREKTIKEKLTIPYINFKNE